MVSASFRLTTPTMRPCSSTRRTLGTAISSLTRGPSRVGVKFIGGLAIYVLLQNIDMASRRRHPAACRRIASSSSMWGCGLGSQSSDGGVKRKNFLLFAAQAAQRDGALLGLALANHEHRRHLRQAVLAHLVVDFLVGEIGLDAQPLRPAQRAHLLGIGVGI